MDKATRISLAAIVASSIVASPLNAQGLKFGGYNYDTNDWLKVASSIAATPLNTQGLKFGESHYGPNGGLRWHNGNASHFWACFLIYGGVKEASHLIFRDVNKARKHGFYAVCAAAFGKELYDLYVKRNEPSWPDWNGAFNDLAYGAAGAGAAFFVDEFVKYTVKSMIKPFKKNKKEWIYQNCKVDFVLTKNSGMITIQKYL